jgi:hypothetical protein
MNIVHSLTNVMMKNLEETYNTKMSLIAMLQKIN